MYQGNQLAVLPENNGRASSSKRTKHLNIRYFLSPTESKRVTFILSIDPPTIWSLIFYQTSARQEISPVQKINYESTGLKSTLTKGVCLESTSFILYKLSSVWIPVTITSCYISNTRMDYLMFNIDYFGFTIWYPFTIWHLFTNWHIFTIVIDILVCLLAKTWELLTIIIQYISSI